MNINISSKLNKYLKIINTICACYIIFWILAPIAVNVFFLKVIVIMCTLIWFITAVIISKSLFLNNKIIAILTYLLLLYISFSSYLSLGALGFSSQVSLIIFVFLSLFYLYYKDNQKESLRFLFIFTVVLVTIFGAITLVKHFSIPIVSRLVTGKDFYELNYLFGRGVGGYNLVFSIAILMPVLFFYVLNNDFKYSILNIKTNSRMPIISKREKIISIAVQVGLIVILLMFCSLIYVAKFSYAIITVFISFAIIIMAKLRTKTNIIIVTSILIAATAFITLVATKSIVIPDAYSSYISKLNSLITSIRSGKPVGAFNDKLALYGESYRLMLRYPLGGVIYVPQRVAGGHSFLLDNLATFGIIVGLLIDFICVYVPIKHLHRKYKVFPLALCQVIATIIVLGLDSLPYGSGAVFFICFLYVKNEIFNFEDKKV